MDGPHALAMLDFQHIAYSQGRTVLDLVAPAVASRVSSELGEMDDPFLRGAAIIGASLLKATSGALPPWSVELMPAVFSGLFVACGKDLQMFGRILEKSMQVRFAAPSNAGSCLIAGKVIEGLSEQAKLAFVQQSLEAIGNDNEGGWRRFKVLVKQACGGKKKAYGFSLKPSPTSWDCDRL